MVNAARSVKQALQARFPNFRKRKWLTRETAVRMLADAVMINVALLLSLVIRYVWSVDIVPDAETISAGFASYLRAYLSVFWMLTLIGLILFYSSGFYTYGRVYAGRYKTLVIAQAVSLTYLVFGVILLLLREVLLFPRAVLFLAWVLTLLFMIGSRVWVDVWSRLWIAEHPPAVVKPTEQVVPNVLVIGGAGYIGCALVERLLEIGYKVGVLELFVYGDGPITRFYENPNFELIRGDFRRIDTVVKAAKGRDAVIHLGAIVGDSACSVCEDLTVEINLRATRSIAEIGKGFGVKRFIFASTCSVYGASDELLDERSCLNPISLYARTKMESEKELLGLTDDSFAPTILRFGTIYGLSGRPRFDLVLNLLTAKAIQEGEAGIFGGAQWRPLVHVKDVAEAIVLALQAPLETVSGEIFNVGCNEQNYQIAELGPIIQEMVPTAHIVVQPTEDRRNYRVRFDKIRNVLNFQPRYTIRDGIAEIIDAFATKKITDYRDPHFNNFNFLREHDKLLEHLPTEYGDWEWDRVTPADAALISALIMAVVECGSDELRGRLREALVQVILGDIDGFLDILTGMRLSRPPQVVAAPAPGSQAVPVERPADTRPAIGEPVPA
jgi:nucleoside-diphosphate-sugar epimerase